MVADILLAVIAFAVIIIGIIGCILPIIPGPPLSFAGVLILKFFTSYGEKISTEALLIVGIIAIVVQILDYFVPVWGTKKFGGTKYGTWGSMIGLLAGIILLPMLGIVIGPFGIIGIIGGPFFGALIGETIAGQKSDKAMRAAFGSFIGFLTGTLMKLVTSIGITIYAGYIVFS